MRRLRDEIDADDPVVARAARLLQAEPPLVESEGRKRRVRAALRARGPRRRRRALWLQPAMVAGLLMATVAVAGAAALLGRVLAERASSHRAPGSAPSPPRPHHRPSVAPAVVAAPPIVAVDAASHNENGATRDVAAHNDRIALHNDHAMRDAAAHTRHVAAHVDDARDVAPHNTAPAARSKDSTSGTPAADAAKQQVVVASQHESAPEGALDDPMFDPPPSAASGGAGASAALVMPRAAAPAPPGAELVLTAYRALRAEHDPARAGLLLDRYLADHPDGALAEDALALAIEAAAGRDDARAAALGARYLARFPSGRYRAAAERARARAAVH